MHLRMLPSLFVTKSFGMSDGLEVEPLPQGKPISRWDKVRSNILKSIRISYMNWTYLPRSTGVEETWQERLFRYSHFPMATQFFTYFAYRAACQVALLL